MVLIHNLIMNYNDQSNITACSSNMYLLYQMINEIVKIR